MPQTAAQKREARTAARAAREAELATAKADGAPRPPSEIEKLNEARALNPLATPFAAGETAKPQRSGSKVFVGCKLGITSYAIQVSELIDKDEQSPMGMRTVKEAVRTGPIVVLRGTAYPRGTPPEGFPEKPIIVAGAALTMVDRDFWVAWVKVNEKNPVVVNRMVFAAESMDEFQGMAAELAKETSGLDPLNPKGNDPRMPKSSRKGEVLELETLQK